ncbi:DUF819 domain-containing protein [Paremcibacter congregatus]|uniref:DUF819 family protein n=1 Tax=Paremcibacter congregatus TaxID=2043170 RepID=UPI003A9397DC
MNALIQADWQFAIWAALMLLAALGFWADKTRLGSNISGAAIILATGMALSNFGILPKQAEAYGVVWTYLVPVAIPLLLLKADLGRVLFETKSMLAAFFFGAVGTTIGALVGYMLLPLGEHGPKLAAVLSATYIGGSMNMAAVTQAVELDPSIVTASVAADNVVGVIYLAFLALVPSLAFFKRLFPTVPAYGPVPVESEDTDTAFLEEGLDTEDRSPRINLAHIGLALGLSLIICALGSVFAEMLGLGGYSIMFVTAITILIANLFPEQLAKLKGDYEVGLLFMYVFFAAIGISADVVAMLDNALVIALFAAIIVFCHALLIFGLSSFFRFDLMEVVIASNACASGPASAAALAAGKGRRDLVAPAVLLGVFGYAVANFIGVSLNVWLGA